MRNIIIFSLFTCFSSTALAGDLTIKLTDFRNSNGKVLISIFNDKDAFDNIDAEKIHTYVSLDTDGKDKEVVLKDFPAGEYAITILQDENENYNLDLNSREFPVEGYGFSNNVGTMSEPSYGDAAFDHTGETDTNQTIKLVYIM